jgi:DNA polymerase delta subunit 4
MVTTRRSAAGARARAGPDKNQSTISFAARVTKHGAPNSAGKAGKTKANDDGAAHLEAAASTTPKAGAEEMAIDSSGEDSDDDVVAHNGSRPSKEAKEAAGDDASEVRQARSVDDKEIQAYMARIDAARLAKTVNQDDLDVGERVLRYFDVSLRYGPCIGISRQGRWQRAHRLGLAPPIEVLSVLLRHESGDEGEAVVQTSQMERLMGATAVGAS